MEQGNEASSGLGELFSKQVDHIPEKHLQFFVKWYQLLSEEERCCRARDGPPFWLSTAAERSAQNIVYKSHCVSTSEQLIMV